MEHWRDLLAADAVRTDVAVGAKKALFAHVGAVAAAVLDLDAEDIAQRLAAREKLGSTGFGGGAAIPHAKVPGLERVRGVLLRLAQPIEYRAVDDMPVDIVFALLSPPDAGADHLKALAQVSRRLRDPQFVAKLRGAGSRDALYALFAADESRDAA